MTTTSMTKETRTETDSFGPIEVRSDVYWGAQTQRSIENFRIGGERFPRPLIRALGIIKHASATVNQDLGKIEARLADAIRQAAQEVIDSSGGYAGLFAGQARSHSYTASFGSGA